MDIIVARTMRPVNITIVMSAHGYNTGCPNDKKHAYEFCDGYLLAYKAKWNSLDDDNYTAAKSQAQGDSTVRLMAATIM